MALNWAMLPSPQTNPPSFIPLENESIVFHTSTPRASLVLEPIYKKSPTNESKNKNQQNDLKPHIKCSNGSAFITNSRLIYLPQVPLPEGVILGEKKSPFLSLSIPIHSMHDAHLVQPWFGPISWQAIIVATPNGGLDTSKSTENVFKFKLTFNDSGAYEFDAAFTKLRENLQQGVQHIDELPAYSE